MGSFRYLNHFLISILLLTPLFSIAQIDSIPVVDKVNLSNFNYYQTINRNPQQGLVHAKESFDYYDQLENIDLKFKVASNYITALYINERFNEAIKTLKAINSSELSQSSKALYYTLNGLVNSELNLLSEAEQSYRQALAIYIALNDKDNIFTIYNNLGILYNNIGDYKRSLDAFLSGSDHIEKVDSKIDVFKYYLNVGTVNFNLNDFDNALVSYKSALNAAINQSETLRIFKAHEKIGETYISLENLEEAFKNYEKALSGYTELGLKKESCNSLVNLGEISLLQNKSPKASEYFEKALQLAINNDFIQEKSIASLKISKLLFEKSLFLKAKPYLLKIIQDKNQIANIEVLSNAYSLLYQIEKQQGNNSAALNYLELFQETDTEIKNIQYSNQKEQFEIQSNLKQKEIELDNLQISYNLNELQLENRKQQINGLIILSVLIAIVFMLVLRMFFQNKKTQRILSVQNEKINHQNKKLLLTNKEIKSQRKELSDLNVIKDQLLSIIAHDVKSPMTDLNNLLFILRHNIDTIQKEDLKNHLAVIESNTSNLLNLLNNVLNWTLNQSKGIKVNKSVFLVSELVQNNLNQIESSAVSKEINVEFRTKESDATVNSDYNIINFALRNILSNAVKFTNTKGKVLVDIIENNNSVFIKIADNGIGFNEKVQVMLRNNSEKVPTTSGTNKEKGYGIGLSLCKKMLSEINASIQYEANEPKGSIFSIQIPT